MYDCKYLILEYRKKNPLARIIDLRGAGTCSENILRRRCIHRYVGSLPAAYDIILPGGIKKQILGEGKR
jgi:hypothetical protein